MLHPHIITHLKLVTSMKILSSRQHPYEEGTVTEKSYGSIRYIVSMWKQTSVETLQKIPQFHLISWCGNFVERYSFGIVLGESPKTMRKLCLSTKFLHKKLGEITVFFCGEFFYDSLTSTSHDIINTASCSIETISRSITVLCQISEGSSETITPVYWTTLPQVKWNNADAIENQNVHWTKSVYLNV